MSPEPASKIPTAALVLGWLGVLPFAGLAASIAAGSALGAARDLNALGFYGAVILSFMGGAQWGLALRPSGDAPDLWRRLAISVLPALVAWVGLAALPVVAMCSVQAAAFALILTYDIATVRWGWAPAWYARLRAPLTAVVVVCLLVPMAVLGV